MPASTPVNFLFKFATLGLAAAFILLLLRPGLMNVQRPVVEIRQQGDTASARATTVTAAVPARTGSSFSGAVNKASPAVVNIYSSRRISAADSAPSSNDDDDSPFPHRPPGHPKQARTGLGSGVLLSPQGYLLTNNHVIAKAESIKVKLNDGRSTQADLVGTDPETDLAVLRVDLPNLTAITLADSNELAVGDVVLAIGNPFAVGQTVTMGIVSATGRKRLGLNTYENFIQTDAAINPGNSGGALINAQGHLVGINTAIFSHSGGFQGIGFAIPANLARDVMQEIIEHGHVVRGWLGISMRNVTSELAEQEGLDKHLGVFVSNLFQGSPAADAGLKPGDILVRVNGQPINDSRHMLDVIARQPPGSSVRIEGVRGGKSFTVRAQIAQRPKVERN